MVRGCCHWLILWLMASPVLCSAAYLRLLGPGELRFLPMPPERSVLVAPVETNTQALIRPAEAGTTNGAVESHTAVDDLVRAALEGLVPTNGMWSGLEPVVVTVRSPEPRETNDCSMPLALSIDAASSGGLITPQMMVPFFQGRHVETNRMSGAIGASIVFMPPVPQSRTGSKVSYSTPE